MELGKPVGCSASRWWFPALLAFCALSRGVEAAHGAIQIIHGDSPSFENVTLPAPGSGLRSPVADLASEPESAGLPPRSGIRVLPEREPVAGDGRAVPFPRSGGGPAARVTPIEAVVAVAATLVVLALRRGRRRSIAGR